MDPFSAFRPATAHIEHAEIDLFYPVGHLKNFKKVDYEDMNKCIKIIKKIQILILYMKIKN